jgi:hypothetical protein
MFFSENNIAMKIRRNQSLLLSRKLTATRAILLFTRPAEIRCGNEHASNQCVAKCAKYLGQRITTPSSRASPSERSLSAVVAVPDPDEIAPCTTERVVFCG